MQDQFSLEGKTYCFYLPHGKRVDGELHYFPSIVIKDEPGHWVTDWDYGTDFKIAQEAVDNLNQRRFNFTPEQASDIVMSSMVAGKK